MLDGLSANGMELPLPLRLAEDWQETVPEPEAIEQQVLSLVPFERNSLYGTAGTSTWMSMRSSRGPEILPR